MACNSTSATDDTTLLHLIYVTTMDTNTHTIKLNKETPFFRVVTSSLFNKSLDFILGAGSNEH